MVAKQSGAQRANLRKLNVARQIKFCERSTFIWSGHAVGKFGARSTFIWSGHVRHLISRRFARF
jgi:hypothetical protein